MKGLIFFALAAGLIATQSAALSCLRPDLARSFNATADLPYDIAIFVGQISRDSKPVKTDGGSTEFFNGRFEGYQVGSNGRSDDFVTAITVERSCAGPWCGDVPQGGEMIFFMSPAEGIGANGWLASFGPCGGSAFLATAENMTTLQSCMKGEACEPDSN